MIVCACSTFRDVPSYAEATGTDRCAQRALLTRPPHAATVVTDPIPVPIHEKALKSLADVLDDGETVWFTDADREPLPFELVGVSTDGAIEAWVGWPEFAKSEGSEIWVYVGDPGLAPEVEPMWSGYAGVWHFADGTTPDAFGDSSGNGNHGSALLGASLVDGVIGSAASLDGKQQHVVVADADSIRTDDFTISAWIRLRELAANAEVVSKAAEDTDRLFRSFGLGVRSDGTVVGFGTPKDSMEYSTFVNEAQDPLIKVDSWFHVTYTRNRDDGVLLFVDGVQVHEQDFTQPLNFDGGSLYLGAQQTPGGLQDFFPGDLDEVFIEQRSRTPQWIELSYAAQSEPSYEVGEFVVDESTCTSE